MFVKFTATFSVGQRESLQPTNSDFFFSFIFALNPPSASSPAAVQFSGRSSKLLQ